MTLITKTRLCLLAASIFGYFSLFYSYGPIAGGAGDRTGSPLNSGLTCSNGAGCHTVAGAYTPTVTVQLINSSNVAVTSYTQGNSYTVRITMTTTTGSNPRYGFQIVALGPSPSYANVNTWGTPPSSTNLKTLSGRTYVEQYSTLSTNVVNIPWTGPASSTGNITFYCAGNIVNYNGQESGDNCATTSLTITPAGSGCVPPALATSVINASCNGGNNGSITLNTTGGTSPFIFAWTGPGNFNASTQNISGIKAGNYRVVVTATGGCTDTAYATVTEPSTPTTASASSNTPICVNGTLNLIGSATGALPIIYSWSGPGSASSNSQNYTLTSMPLNMSGKYILTIQDQNGCVAKDTEDVVVNDGPTVDSIKDTLIGTGICKFSMANPKYVQKYVWDFGDGVKDSSIAAPVHIFGPGTHTITLIISNDCGADTLYKNIDPVGIDNQLSNGPEVKIYPNPANTYFVVKTEIPGEITLYNIHGIRLYESPMKTKEATVDVSLYPQGMYFITVETGNGTVYKKVEIK